MFEDAGTPFKPNPLKLKDQVTHTPPATATEVPPSAGLAEAGGEDRAGSLLAARATDDERDVDAEVRLYGKPMAAAAIAALDAK